MDKGVHDGHRDRMRERIEKNGISSLNPHEMLEYLLFTFVPRKDTNEIAHALIDCFGSLSGVLNADAEHLAEVKGMTRNAALFLSVLPDVFRAYAADVDATRTSLNGKGVTRKYLEKQMYGRPTEQVYIAALDAKDNLIKFEKLNDGDGCSVEVSIRAVVQFALRTKATAIILAHNHPGGNPRPSRQDIMLTREIFHTLYSMNIILQDHIVFSNSTYYSFEEDGKMRLMENEREIQLKDGIYYYE